MRVQACILVFCLGFFVQQSATTEEAHGVKHPVSREVINLTRKFSKYCKAKTNVTEEDMAVIKDEQIPDTRSGLSYLECMLEKMGVVTRGQFKKHAVVAAFEPMMRHNPERRALLKRIGEECAIEIEGKQFNEYGDLAKELFQCFEKYENICDVKIPTEYL